MRQGRRYLYRNRVCYIRLGGRHFLKLNPKLELRGKLSEREIGSLQMWGREELCWFTDTGMHTDCHRKKGIGFYLLYTAVLSGVRKRGVWAH